MKRIERDIGRIEVHIEAMQEVLDELASRPNLWPVVEIDNV